MQAITILLQITVQSLLFSTGIIIDIPRFVNQSSCLLTALCSAGFRLRQPDPVGRKPLVRLQGDRLVGRLLWNIRPITGEAARP